MKNRVCELLAPAGNPECALAAIDAGADAVYCGLGRFNARCRAENFDNGKLGALIDFMHSKGKKLYLTFNTLLFEDELEAAGEMLSDLVQLAPDALIVHDPGVIEMVKKYFPSLTLHASTQMGIHNSSGVKALADMGIQRVILERQIPLDELEKIVRRSPIEIEVFVHGSLCCSLSGRCLLSAELCGGSGNRGCCKQPCRRAFETAEGELFPLSMRDLNGVAILPELKAMGVASLDQLAVWCDRAKVELVRQNEGSDPAAVVFDACHVAKNKKADVLIIDTAGRLHNKTNLMNELAKINRVIDRELPGVSRENLLVLDATTGQNAILQAKEFKNAAQLTGLILNKLDGTAKGGIVISIRRELNIPVKFIGVGEKLDDMQEFDQAEFVKALFE